MHMYTVNQIGGSGCNKGQRHLFERKDCCPGDADSATQNVLLTEQRKGLYRQNPQNVIPWQLRDCFLG